MIKILILLAAIIILPGCAITAPTIADHGPRHITIIDNFGAADTHGMAETYCQQGGLHAIFQGYTDRPVAICYSGNCQYFQCIY